jgi:hypothetical protein
MAKKTVMMDVGHGNCDVCGKEDGGVLIQQDVQITISVFICEGCWSGQFRRFNKEPRRRWLEARTRLISK